MKILVITQYFYPETFRVNELCIELTQRGHEVHVLTGYPQYPYGKIYSGYGFNIPYQKKWNNIHIERIRMFPRGKTPIGMLLNCISFVKQGIKWVEKCNEHYDIVYVFEVSPVTVGLPALEYKKKFNTPILFNVQDLWPENVECVLGIHNKIIINIINKIVDKIYANSNKILCSSESFVENIKKRGILTDKLIFWPQFCKIPNQKKKKPACYSEKKFNIVFAGNVGAAQGLDLLINSAKFTDVDVHWYIVGDGRAKKKLYIKAQKMNLLDKISFIGRVSADEANNYIEYADCAYLSFCDNKIFDMTIPAKLQTYLSCGTPILAAVSGESKYIIEKANCGIVVDRNAKSVCNGIQQLKSLQKEQIMAIKNNCYNYYNNNYTIELLIDKLEDIMLKELKKVENITN